LQDRLSSVFPEVPRDEEGTAVVPGVRRATDGCVTLGGGFAQATKAVGG